MQTLSKRALPIIVMIAGLWALYVVVFRPQLFELSREEVAALEGCYAVGGQQVMELRDQSIITPQMTVSFKAVHEKNTDSLILDAPLESRLADGAAILTKGGSVDKLPIIYDRPIRITVRSRNGPPLELSKAECARSEVPGTRIR